MTDNNIRIARIHAYNSQGGRCFYCSNPIWEKSLETWDQAAERLTYGRMDADCKSHDELISSLECTAEHFEPVSGGGSNQASNIKAACHHCNSNRNAMSVDEWRQRSRKNNYLQEAGHDRSVVNGEWRDNVAYDFRWNVVLFIQEHPVWVDIACQEHLSYTSLPKNHWIARHNDAVIYPLFEGSLKADSLRIAASSPRVIKATQLILENPNHERTILNLYKDKILSF